MSLPSTLQEGFEVGSLIGHWREGHLFFLLLLPWHENLKLVSPLGHHRCSLARSQHNPLRGCSSASALKADRIEDFE